METAAWLVGHTWRIVGAAQKTFKAPASESLGVFGGRRPRKPPSFSKHIWGPPGKSRQQGVRKLVRVFSVLLARGSVEGGSEKDEAVEQPPIRLIGAVQRLNKAEICFQGLQPACTLRITRNACPADMP